MKTLSELRMKLSFMRWFSRILILTVLILPCVMGVRLGISPSEMQFEGNAGEEICREAVIYFDRGEVILEDRWNGISEEREMILYTDKAEGLKVEYPHSIWVEGKEEARVCIAADEGGRYFGVILASAREGAVGVGSWIVAEIEEREEKKGIFEGKGMVLGFEMIFLMVLTGILGYAWFKKEQRIYSEI